MSRHQQVLLVVCLVCILCSTSAWRPGGHLLVKGRQQGDQQQGQAGYPGPGGGDDPTPDALPFTSGMIVNLRSHVLDTFCNVGDATETPPYTLRCSEDASSKVWMALLIIGQDYTTDKVGPWLYDGSKVMLKSQRENKICGLGSADDRYPIVCDQPYSTAATSFVIRRAKARDDLFYIAPADTPDHKCYPAHSAHDHGLEHGAGMDSRPGSARHVMRCDGEHHGDNYLLHITQADYWDAAAAGGSKATYPPWPGAPPYPGGPPGPPAPHHGDVLPFTTGSTIQLAARHMGALVCDTKDGGGYGPGWLSSLLGGKKKHSKKHDDDDKKDKEKNKKKQEEQRIKCDRKAPEGPGSRWMPAGFLVLADNPAERELHSGAALYLSNQQTHKYCRPATHKDLVDGVICDAEKNPIAKFKIFLAKKHRKHHHGLDSTQDEEQREEEEQEEKEQREQEEQEEEQQEEDEEQREEQDKQDDDGEQDEQDRDDDRGDDDDDDDDDDDNRQQKEQDEQDDAGEQDEQDQWGLLARTWHWLTDRLVVPWQRSSDLPPGAGYPGGGDDDDDDVVEVYILHVDSGRYCGADKDTKHALLVCDYKRRNRPKMLIRAHKDYPAGPVGAAAGNRQAAN